MRLIRAFFVFIFWASFTQAQKCPSLGEIRQGISAGNEEQALVDLECLLKVNPRDLDVLRLLSDLHWWRGNVPESERYAKIITDLGGAAQANELGLHIHRRLSRFRTSVGAQGIWNERSKNFEFTAEASARYWKKNLITYRFLRDSRSYESGISLDDINHRFGHLATFNRISYLETAISLTQSATFLPKWKYELEPHLILSKIHDFGIGITFSDYRLENVLSLKPSWNIEINDDLSLGLKAEMAIHPQQAINGQGAINYQWNPRLFTKLTIAGGKSYEGDQLTPKFFSVSLGANFHATQSFVFKLESNLYRSDIRDEYRLGGGIEFIF